MSRPLNELLGAFERNIEGEKNDAVVDVLVLLQNLASAESYVPDFLAQVQGLASDQMQELRSAEAQRLAIRDLVGTAA